MAVELQDLVRWADGLYAFHEQPNRLRRALFLMADALGVVQYLGVPESTWDAFFRRVQGLMRSNPYHNFTHISDVVQAVFCVLHNSGITAWLTASEVTYSFLAAVCHDLDHPGNSNKLEFTKETALARRFPESPLENHHKELSCDRDGILDEFGLLASVSAEAERAIRTGMAELILATDMAKHADKTGQLKELLAGGVEAVRAVRDSPESKCLVLQNLMKCADISNQGRSKAAADFWNAAIYKEFYAEGDLDRREGRDVNPLHNRRTNVVPKSSVGFGNFVVRPMFQLVHDFLELAAQVDPGVVSSATTADALALLTRNTAAYAQEAAALAERQKRRQQQQQQHDGGGGGGGGDDGKGGNGGEGVAGEGNGREAVTDGSRSGGDGGGDGNGAGPRSAGADPDSAPAGATGVGMQRGRTQLVVSVAVAVLAAALLLLWPRSHSPAGP